MSPVSGNFDFLGAFFSFLARVGRYLSIGHYVGLSCDIYFFYVTKLQ
jgi:hypothetical protein